jgi:hypothetical protein
MGGEIAWMAATVAAACGALAGESQHVSGPAGLSGWKVTYLLDNGDEVADTLVIARDGKRIREVHGDPLVWRWMFQDDGKSIAYESGPLHFAMACISIDIASGKQLERLDCFRYPDRAPAGGWPAWVFKLEGAD